MAFAKADSASYLSLGKIADKDVQLATPPRPGNQDQVTLDYITVVHSIHIRIYIFVLILSNRYDRRKRT